jgi:threonine dehydrogenase-like Zn-dependent dehydrogenase
LKDFQVAIDTLDSGHIAPRSMVTDRIALDAVPTAFEALRQRTTQCKVMIDPWASR